MQRCHSFDWQNAQHKAGLHYKFTNFNLSYWRPLQRFGCFNSATSFHSLVQQNESSTKLLHSTLYSACIIICKFSEFNKRSVAIKPIDTSANLEDHHWTQHPFFFTSFVHECNVIDPVDVRELKRDTRHWLYHCKQDEDCVCRPSL